MCGGPGSGYMPKPLHPGNARIRGGRMGTVIQAQEWVCVLAESSEGVRSRVESRSSAVGKRGRKSGWRRRGLPVVHVESSRLVGLLVDTVVFDRWSQGHKHLVGVVNERQTGWGWWRDSYLRHMGRTLYALAGWIIISGTPRCGCSGAGAGTGAGAGMGAAWTIEAGGEAHRCQRQSFRGTGSCEQSRSRKTAETSKRAQGDTKWGTVLTGGENDDGSEECGDTGHCECGR